MIVRSPKPFMRRNHPTSIVNKYIVKKKKDKSMWQHTNKVTTTNKRKEGRRKQQTYVPSSLPRSCHSRHLTSPLKSLSYLLTYIHNIRSDHLPCSLSFSECAYRLEYYYILPPLCLPASQLCPFLFRTAIPFDSIQFNFSPHTHTKRSRLGTSSTRWQQSQTTSSTTTTVAQNVIKIPAPTPTHTHKIFLVTHEYTYDSIKNRFPLFSERKNNK